MRTDQMHAFTQIAFATFESDMVAHCMQLSPQRCEALGDERLRTAIRATWARAAGHGWTCRGPVRLYIELTLLFGSAFDSDPQYPWASGILAGGLADASVDETADSAVQRQIECAEQMFEKSREQLQQQRGPDGRFQRAAAGRMAALLQSMPDLPADGFLAAVQAELRMAHPEKADCIGEPALDTLIRAAVAQARVHALGTPRGAAVFAVLMFAFGHACLDDPLVPWIRASMVDEPGMDPPARLARLQARASAWLEQSAAEPTSSDRP